MTPIRALILCSTVLLIISCKTKMEGTISLEGQWQFKIDSADVGIAERWYAPEYNKIDWQLVELPSYWDRYHLDGYDGVGWFARTIDLGGSPPESNQPSAGGGAMAVFFEGVDDDADVWLNGIKVGSHAGYSDAFYFDITPAMKPGVNELVVRVFDHSGPGGIYGPVIITPSKHVEALLRTEYASLSARPSAQWTRDAVIYEVYLRSFSPQGTFRALERRVEELKKLGVTVLWLMPIHPIGELNRKGTLGSPYAVADYYSVNPEFGTLEDFKSLVKTVHDHGMKIIIDLVANHTAWDSKLMFEYPEWFSKDETGAIVSPNSDWTDVAELNYNHHELRKYMVNMMKYWVGEVGIDGFRCDVAELVPTDFWELARRELDKIKPVMMLSEGTLPEHHVKAFDITYAWNTYDVLEKVLQGTTAPSVFGRILRTESYRFPRGSLRMRFSTNHDKNAWDAPAVLKFGREGAKAASVLMFTLPGVPLIYNGEEVGNAKRLDLFEKVAIDWSGGSDFRTLFEQLTSLRASHPAIRYGSITEIGNSHDTKVLSYVRKWENDSALVVVSCSERQETIRVKWEASSCTEVMTGAIVHAAQGEFRLTLKPFGFQVLIPQKESSP